MAEPITLHRRVSPPPLRRDSTARIVFEPREHYESPQSDARKTDTNTAIPSAAIESGQVEIHDHLSHFAQKFLQARRPRHKPILPIADFQNLYTRNQYEQGRHWVLHQHDHPISGVHYDLRLQFSRTSTVSFAIPYGLPGNANSVRPHRMAIETRVHNLWNNLIESASHASGSLLIWDTGEYEILPGKEEEQHATTDEEDSDVDEPTKTSKPEYHCDHNERLKTAFQNHHISLRLHGARLPPNYTISLRLPTANAHHSHPRQPKRKRRRVEREAAAAADETSSDSDVIMPSSGPDEEGKTDGQDEAFGTASDEERSIQDNNAYPGAENTIGSIHQRHWFLTLDRRKSHFHKLRGGSGRGRWTGGWEPFFVRGRDHERSVVTGRSADEVMEDEGEQGFVGRGMWRAVME